MVFCYQNCADLLWEKIVILIKKNFRGWEPRICKNFEITTKIYSDSERSEHFLVTECFFNLFLEVSHVSWIRRIVHILYVLGLMSDSLTTIFTTSWGCWKHVFGIPGARPMFLKAEFCKEFKNGFKTINSRPSSVMIFSKYCFQSKKIIIKIGRFVDFWIFMAIYINNLDHF